MKTPLRKPQDLDNETGQNRIASQRQKRSTADNPVGSCVQRGNAHTGGGFQNTVRRHEDTSTRPGFEARLRRGHDDRSGRSVIAVIVDVEKRRRHRRGRSQRLPERILPVATNVVGSPPLRGIDDVARLRMWPAGAFVDNIRTGVGRSNEAPIRFDEDR